jgi:hypothetical protein
MYYGKGLKDLISKTPLTIEFFQELDEFTIHYIDMQFKKLLDDQMGLMGEIENQNYHIFQDFLVQYNFEKYGVEPSYWKKAS